MHNPEAMTPADLRERTTAFAVEVVTFCRQLRQKPEARNIADQISNSSTSTAANYRAACRARSHREFISKIAIAVEEADESVGWLEVITRAGLASGAEPEGLLREGQEILAILAASRRTAEANRPARG
jgi:four helix bundle protein